MSNPFRILSLLLLFFAIAVQSNGQRLNADSLWAIWEDEAAHDTVRLEALRAAIWQRYFFKQPDSAFYYAGVLGDEAQAIGDEKLQAEGLNIQAGTFYIKGEIEKAIPYAERYVQMYEDNWPESRNLATALINMGSLYSAMGKKVQAIRSFERSEKIAAEHNYIDVQGGALMNLGNEYESLGEFDIAIDYLERSLEMRHALGDPGKLGITFSNLALAYKGNGDTEKALEFNLQAIAVHEELDDAFYIGSSLLMMGELYRDLGQLEEAKNYLNQALDLSRDNDLKQNLSNSTISLGQVYYELNEFDLARDYCQAGLDLAYDLKLFEEELAACECLYDVYKAMKQNAKALVFHEQVVNLQDSLNVTETAKELQRMEFDKEVLADSLRRATEQHSLEMAHQEELSRKDKAQNQLIAGTLILLIVAGGLYHRNRFVTKSRSIIQKEKDRSDELLLNILPAEVAEELKEKGEAEAQLIDQVTVLFTDFSGFTAMSEQLSPKELVNDLNACFSEFDRITAKYGVEKIKTIGDSYMAAGGLPIPNRSNAIDVIKAALEMRDFVAEGKVKKKEQGLPYFEIRIGVHTGPVVAGIVGVKKFQYDIWGDTVNIASRMESSGQVGRVNISRYTYELLKDQPDFVFESRGKIETKGKGEIEMYFLERT